MMTMWRKFRNFSNSLISATRFSDKCNARSRGKGPKFDKLLRPLSSIRNSLNERRPSKEPSSTCFTLFLSKTSSLSCSMCDRPSSLVISLPGKWRMRKVCRGNCAKKLMSVMPLTPISKTCRCGMDAMPPTWSPSASMPFSKSSFVRFTFSTSSFDSGPMVLMSEKGFPFKLNSRSEGKTSSLSNWPSSLKFWPDKSTDRKL
mmetsp:Transcript_138423/g.442402  ORF Transcript_138423/g.442402 Transcript_138423/m.442402 type:complete len:202 (+) Transcript_138423:721-1326(+)